MEDERTTDTAPAGRVECPHGDCPQRGLCGKYYWGEECGAYAFFLKMQETYQELLKLQVVVLKQRQLLEKKDSAVRRLQADIALLKERYNA